MSAFFLPGANSNASVPIQLIPSTQLISETNGYRFRIFLFVVFVILFVFFFCEWSNKHKRQYSIQVRNGVNAIVEEASRTSTYAKNTANPFLSVLQDSEALGMIKAMKLLAPEEDIQKLTGIPLTEMEREIKN